MKLTRSTVATTLILAGLLSSACRPAPEPQSPLDRSPDGAAAILDAATLEQRLKAAGIMLTLDSELPTHYLPGTARIYAVEGSEERVELYRYADEAQAGKAASGISPDGSTMMDPQDPRGQVTVKWPAPPHVYQRGQLLVIYAGSRSTVLEALAAGLGDPVAGAD